MEKRKRYDDSVSSRTKSQLNDDFDAWAADDDKDRGALPVSNSLRILVIVLAAFACLLAVSIIIYAAVHLMRNGDSNADGDAPVAAESNDGRGNTPDDGEKEENEEKESSADSSADDEKDGEKTDVDEPASPDAASEENATDQKSGEENDEEIVVEEAAEVEEAIIEDVAEEPLATDETSADAPENSDASDSEEKQADLRPAEDAETAKDSESVKKDVVPSDSKKKNAFSAIPFDSVEGNVLPEYWGCDAVALSKVYAKTLNLKLPKEVKAEAEEKESEGVDEGKNFDFYNEDEDLDLDEEDENGMARQAAPQKRVAISQPLLGEISLGSYVAFCLTPKSLPASVKVGAVPPDNERVAASYDANARTLTIKGNMSLESESSIVKRFRIDNNLYSGLFAKDPDAYKDASYCLIFRSTTAVRAKKAKSVVDTQETWTLKGVGANYYKKFGNRLAVACIGRLAVPPQDLLQNFQKVLKDEDDMIEDWWSGDSLAMKRFMRPFYALYLTDVEYWVYDYPTGRVFAKFTANDARNSVARRWGDLSAGSKTFAKDQLPDDWPTTLAKSQDRVEKWEVAPSDIFVPDDAPTLVDAINQAKDGQVIVVAKSGNPVPFGVIERKKGFDPSGLILEKSITIRGETGKPDDCAIQFSKDQYLEIDVNAKVNIKGISFVRAWDAAPNAIPLFKVRGEKVVFKNCAFYGSIVNDSVGVDVTEGTTLFWKCAFCQFRDSALRAQSGGKASLAYCEIGEENENGVCALNKGTINVSRSLFFKNTHAYVAKEGGGGKVERCFFQENTHPWGISLGSARVVKKLDNVEE